jgi:hypothetical protein
MNPLVKLVASALPGEKKYIIFVGAGVSKDAGIPTAWDLMIKTAGLIYAAESKEIDPDINLEDWFIKSKYAQMEYSQLIEQIYPKYPDQQSFFKDYLNKKEIGKAHKGIAELARREIIRAIITTNFDHYIERALEEKGLAIQVISTDEDLKNSEPLIHCKSIRIYKPHGDLGHGALKNTPKDLEKLSPLMEEELIKILSEHGVIVIGYAGFDKGIQQILQKRSYNYYPLFWVNPKPPEGKIKEVLEKKDYTYIPCTGASQFIDDFLKLIERIEDIAPEAGKGPTISDLKYAFSSEKEPVKPIYLDFLKNVFNDLKKTKPDFSKFSEYDDAIVAQVKEGIPISYRFIEAVLLASKYNELGVFEIIYEFFGNVLKLYDVPEDFSGSYRETDFDGFIFLGYEMFVSFIASLIKHDKWEAIGEILKSDLFIERKYESKYVPFKFISRHVRSLDDIRNGRLKLNRISLIADYYKERFTESELSQLIDHREFLEADYFLFMRTVCYEDNLEYLRKTWCPRSCVYLHTPPKYIIKAQSRKFLEKLIVATGFSSSNEFIERLKNNHSAFNMYFRRGWIEDPLRDFDLNSIGTRN